MNVLLSCLVFAATTPIAIGCGGGASYRKAHAATPAAAPMPSGETVEVTAATDGLGLQSVPSAPQAGQAGPAAPAPAPRAPAAQGTTTAIPEQMVVQGTLDLEVEDAERTARALRDEAERLGGRVVSESVDGAEPAWRATIRLRMPPAQVDAVVAWLDGQGDIVSKRIEAADVSRILFDQEIALGNLTTTLERLRKLLDTGGLKMQEILEIEKEMTRLRGEIERIKGEKRFLEDRVALATLDVSIRRREGELGPVMSARTKIYPGPRIAALTLFDPGGRQRTRLGGGVAIHIIEPRFSLELDVFEDAAASGDQPAENNALLATYGMAMYSDFLGRGRRKFLNPYIGARIGYGYLDYHALAVQGQVGVELFKHQYVMVDIDVRATALLGEQVDAGLVSGASIVFAF